LKGELPEKRLNLKKKRIKRCKWGSGFRHYESEKSAV